MADDPQKRLEAHARQPVPPIDPRFADQLESKLRVEHAAQSPASQRRIRVVLPRLAAAAAIVVAAGLGITALSNDEPSVPVAIVDNGTTAPLDAAADGGSGDEQDTTDRGDPADPGQAIADPSAVPTPTVQSAGPGPASTETPVQPTAVVALPPASTATPLPSITPATVEPSPTVTVPTRTAPSPTESAQTPTPTPTSPAGSTPVPAATPVPVPRPTATASPEPTPTAEREPVLLELMCEARVVGDVVGVVCSWRVPESDRIIADYRITRSRNGGEAQVIARQRASAPLSYADRDVDFGDQVIYMVQGLDAGDSVVAASVRETVTVLPQD